MPRCFQRLSVVALVLSAIFVAAPDAHAQKQVRSSSELRASSVAVVRANELRCVLTNNGHTCDDVFTSTLAHGAVWPRGTTNGYIFDAGIQLTGIVPIAASCSNRDASSSPGCFPWAGDTTGAMYVNMALTNHAQEIAYLYDSLEDLDEWPQAPVEDLPSLTAFVHDDSIFDASLIGRAAVSAQDTWTAYTDGSLGGSRPHPLGVLVEQRTLAWDYPYGNEATIFLIYRLTNITGTQHFQVPTEKEYFEGADRLPDAGWPLDSLYFSFVADFDVTNNSTNNYLSAVMPFGLMLGYDHDFSDADFEYTPAQSRRPFFRTSPGLIASVFLRTPRDPATGQQRGLTAMTGFTSGGAFPLPNGTGRAWRAASMNIDPEYGDPSCLLPLAEARERRFCYLAQTTADVRGRMSTGPFSLAPGESETIIVALIAAAPVETPEITPGIANPPGFPTLAPGCGAEPIRPIERTAGWVSTTGCPTLGQLLDVNDVEVVPGSLLGKAMVAQSIVDNRFIMPAAPAAPQFYLVPGSNSITVVWEPSATEEEGDPFFPFASDENSVLHDPNYRRNDVEGYRIYRGTSPDDMTLIAQFDKQGTFLTDALCRTDAQHVTGEPCGTVVEVPLRDDLVQYRTTTTLSSGVPIVVDADTALGPYIREGRALPLEDTGIPFAYTDTEVRNGFSYFYRVTAFDINSIHSGPSSLESTSVTKNAVPRTVATSLRGAEATLAVFGRDQLLEPAPLPGLDATTGTFSGPQPPATIDGQLAVIAGQLLSEGAIEVTIDSIVPGYYPNGTIATYHFTADGEHRSVVFTNRTSQAAPGTTETMELPTVPIEADPAARAALEARGVEAPHLAAQLRASVTVDRPHWNSLHADWAPKQAGFWYSTISDPPVGNLVGGSRWFAGANEAMPDPTADVLGHGTLAGIATIFQPMPYLGTAPAGAPPGAISTAMSAYRGTSADVFRRFYGTVLGVTRAADVRFHWSAGTVDSVIDVTHNVPVQYSPAVRSSYGFLTDADEDGVLTYGDFYYREGLATSPANEIDAFARAHQPFAQQPVVMAVDVDGDLDADGSGFGVYVNGEPYLFLGDPPQSATWTLRTYNGAIARDASGSYTFTPTGRNPAVPGLRLVLNVEQAADIVAAAPDLSRVHTVPDPYYARSIFDGSPEYKELHFVNLPARATVRIYTLSGVLVDVLVHDDPVGGGSEPWDLRGRGNHRVSSGVYLFHVSTPDGRSHVGRFTVISAGSD